MMSLITLSRGTVFEKNNGTFTLQRKVNDSWQIENITTGEISKVNEGDVIKQYLEKSILFHQSDAYIPKRKNGNSLVTSTFDHLSQIQKDELTHKRSFLEAHISRTAKSLVLKDIKESINTLWQEKYGPKPHQTTVSKWLKKYFECGRDILSLLPACHQKGNRNRRVIELVEELCMDAIEERYLTKERGSIKSAHEKAIQLIVNENNNRPKAYHLRIPSINFIRKLIATIPAYDICIARYGAEYARKRFRNTLGHIHSEKPLDVVEIDHTQLDVVIVDDLTREPIGRPWLTLLIDTFTRCILGYHITFDSPSGTSLKNAILHAILPKKIGEYPDTKSGYPMYGVFDVLSADNGMELHGKVLESMCLELGITIKYSARKTPWWKPHVERTIGLLNRNVTEGMPGKTFSNIIEKKDNNPSHDACITMNTLKKVTNKWIVDIYHHQHHRSLSMSPLDCWKKYVDPSKIRIPGAIDRLEIACGVVEKRWLQHYGIELHTIRYNNELLGDIRKIHGVNLNLEIRWNPDNLGSIYVISPDGETIKVNAIDSFIKYADGLTMFQHKCVKRLLMLDNKKTNAENLAIAKQEIYDLIEHDKTLKKKKTRVRQERFLKGSSQSKLDQTEVLVETVVKSHVASIESTAPNEELPKFGSQIARKLATTRHGVAND